MRKEILICDNCENNKAVWKIKLEAVGDNKKDSIYCGEICESCAWTMINKIEENPPKKDKPVAEKPKRVPHIKPEGAANFKADFNPETFVLEEDEKRDQKKILAQMDKAAAKSRKETKGKLDPNETLLKRVSSPEDLIEKEAE